MKWQITLTTQRKENDFGANLCSCHTLHRFMQAYCFIFKSVGLYYYCNNEIISEYDWVFSVVSTVKLTTCCIISFSRATIISNGYQQDKLNKQR